MRDTSSRLAAISIPEEHRLLARVRSLAWGMPLCALLLAAVGLSVVASASAELGPGFLTRQIAWVSLGLVALVVGFGLSYRTLLRLAVPLYLLGLVMLLLVLLFGHEAGGARSWVGIGGLGGQPADFMKLASVLLLVRFLGGSEEARLHERDVVVAMLIAAVPAGLIVLQPDLGSAIILFPAVGALVWLCGLRTKTLAATFVVVVLAGAAAWTFGLKDYQRDRILTFVSPELDPLGAGYQIRQSKIAVGSGELAGKGFMQGTQSQLRFLPARHTDFAFAVLAEERGFVGVAAVLGLYALFLWSGVRVAVRAADRQSLLLVVGLLSILAFHILYNTAMMIGFVPITGIPLPFLSYGGSFMLFCFYITGLVLGVDYRRWVHR